MPAFVPGLLQRCQAARCTGIEDVVIEGPPGAWQYVFVDIHGWSALVNVANVCPVEMQNAMVVLLAGRLRGKLLSAWTAVAPNGDGCKLDVFAPLPSLPLLLSLLLFLPLLSLLSLLSLLPLSLIA